MNASLSTKHEVWLCCELVNVVGGVVVFIVGQTSVIVFRDKMNVVLSFQGYQEFFVSRYTLITYKDDLLFTGNLLESMLYNNNKLLKNNNNNQLEEKNAC